MAKTAALFAGDRTPVAKITISDDFDGYPDLISYQHRLFEFLVDQSGFTMGAVNSADHEVYIEIAAPYDGG